MSPIDWSFLNDLPQIFASNPLAVAITALSGAIAILTALVYMVKALFRRVFNRY